MTHLSCRSCAAGRARQLGTTQAELIRRALERALNERSGLLNEDPFQQFLAYAHQRAQLSVEPRRRDWRREDLYDA